MYVPRRPSIDTVARQRAHQRVLERAVSERATRRVGWQTVPSFAFYPEFEPVPEAPPRFVRDSQGFVLLAGTMRSTFAPDAPLRTVPTVSAFLLPVAYRPSEDIVFVDTHAESAATGRFIGVHPQLIGEVNVTAALVTSLYVHLPGQGVDRPTTSLHGLSGIRFRTN